MFELPLSPCCFLWFQSHSNPARIVVCTHSQPWGWKKGAEIQILAADSARREGAAGCSLSLVLLFAFAHGLSLLLFVSPVSLEDKGSVPLPIPSISSLGRVSGRQAPSRAVHLPERQTQKRQQVASPLVVGLGVTTSRWQGSTEQSWETVNTERPLYRAG